MGQWKLQRRGRERYAVTLTDRRRNGVRGAAKEGAAGQELQCRSQPYPGFNVGQYKSTLSRPRHTNCCGRMRSSASGEPRANLCGHPAVVIGLTFAYNWAKETGQPYSTLYARLTLGWSPHKIVYGKAKSATSQGAM